MRPCEIAQASVFAAALKTEIADLQARIKAAEQRWEKRQSRLIRSEIERPERLVRLRSQLDEANRLFDHCSRVARL
jgi:predicted  nucleic acid-binding Zn-ribbon protein